MQSISRVTVILVLASINGCGQDDKPVTAANTGVLKTQLETLEQSKQVEQVLQDSAEQQRQKIEQETH